MFQYLEKLRRKPEAERRKTVLLISLGVTLIIALVWAVTLSFRLKGADFSIEDQNKSKTSNETPSLKETFSGFMDQVGDIINRSSTYENPGSLETSPN